MTDGKLRFGAAELRLYAVALLALIYVAAWRVIRPAVVPAPVPAIPPIATAPRVQVAPARTRLVRTPVSRPRRVRTRSS